MYILHRPSIHASYAPTNGQSLPITDELAGRLFKKRSAMFIQKHYNEMFPLVSLVEDSVIPSTRPQG